MLHLLLLSDWALLNRDLSSLREDQLKELINAEIAGKKRESFLTRMHQRYAKLVTARQRAEMLEGKLL